MFSVLGLWNALVRHVVRVARKPRKSIDGFPCMMTRTAAHVARNGSGTTMPPDSSSVQPEEHQ